jgi:hypothetical protein
VQGVRFGMSLCTDRVPAADAKTEQGWWRVCVWPRIAEMEAGGLLFAFFV